MTNPYFDLTGKIALVTGGGRGIGRAIAEGLASLGAKVVICGRAMPVLEEAVVELSAKGFDVVAHRMDVVSEAEVRETRDWLRDRFGRLDILVNNAGINPHYATIDKTSMEEWAQIIEVNLTGVFRCCRAFGELMPANAGASVINISSVAGQIGLKKQVPYSASKGGVEQLTKGLAHDWAERGVRVNAVGYGFIETDLTTATIAHPHLSQRLLARVPMSRFGKTSEVAGAAMFLASPSASYVTGQTIMVDGGWTAI